jgi:hypothetical protein
MTVNELIAALSDIEGDLEVYVDITEDVPCSECGDLKHTVYDGFPRYVTVINLDGGKAAHIHAEIDRDE